MPILLLVRHARAGTRGSVPDDLARPLDARGIDQAEALPRQLLPLLTAGDATPVVAASPARRCIDTVVPLAALLHTAVAVEDVLVEGSDVRELHRRLMVIDRPTVWSSHGDVIPGLLEMLARRGLELGPSPRCEKASTWAVTVEAGEAVSARYLPPPF